MQYSQMVILFESAYILCPQIWYICQTCFSIIFIQKAGIYEKGEGRGGCLVFMVSFFGATIATGNFAEKNAFNLPHKYWVG